MEYLWIVILIVNKEYSYYNGVYDLEDKNIKMKINKN